MLLHAPLLRYLRLLRRWQQHAAKWRAAPCPPPSPLHALTAL
jgi:hypothetical protein